MVAQGMRESAILDYTDQMQDYIDDAEFRHDCIALMEQGLHARGVEPSIEAQCIVNVRNRLRYLWAKHWGFELKPTDAD